LYNFYSLNNLGIISTGMEPLGYFPFAQGSKAVIYLSVGSTDRSRVWVKGPFRSVGHSPHIRSTLLVTGTVRIKSLELLSTLYVYERSCLKFASFGRYNCKECSLGINKNFAIKNEIIKL